MSDAFVAVGLGIIALIHLLPVIGVSGRAALERLYGMPFESPVLLVLMRHRAVFFGLVAGIAVYAIFAPATRPLAFVVCGVSIVSYLILGARSAQPALRRVFIADLIALGGLILALVGHFMAA